MEDQKYLPPKYSYSLRDLATDYGIFEKFENQSMISGNSSTNVSIKTMSAFNGNHNKDLITINRNHTGGGDHRNIGNSPHYNGGSGVWSQ
jgi:hypothetical protein